MLVELILAALVFFGSGGAAHAAVSAASHQGVPLWKLLVGLALGGVVLGVGRLLVSNEKITMRLAAGRAIIGGGLALCAGAVLTFIPNIPVLALAGIAAFFAVLGEQYVEKIVNEKFLNK